MTGKQEDDDQQSGSGSGSFTPSLAPAANPHAAMYMDNHGLPRESHPSPHMYPSNNGISGDLRYTQQQRHHPGQPAPPPPPLSTSQLPSTLDSPFIQYQDYNSTSVTPLTASPADSVYSQYPQHQYAYPPRPLMQDIPSGNMGLSLDMQAYPPANTTYSDYNSPPAPRAPSSASSGGHSRAASYSLGVPFSHNEHLQREIQQKQQQLQQLKQALQHSSYRLMGNNNNNNTSGFGINTSDETVNHDNQQHQQHQQQIYPSNLNTNNSTLHTSGQNQFPALSGSSSQLSYRPINAHQPSLLGKAKVTTTLWEDEGTVCFQVEARGVCVARREDNNMINGTKLLNVAGMTRGRRDGILKAEKERYVVKVGAMHLKGVWITFDRALHVARKENIVDLLYPLFVYDIRSLLYPPNYLSTATTRAALDNQRLRIPPNHQQTPSIKGAHSPAPSISQPSHQQQQRWSQQQQQHQQQQYQDYQASSVNGNRLTQDCSPVSGLGVNSAGSDSLSWSPRLTPPVSLNTHRSSPALTNLRASGSAPSTPGDMVMPTIYPQQQQSQTHIHGQPQRSYRQHQYHPSLPQASFNLQLPPSRRSSTTSHRYSNSVDLASYTGRYDGFPDLGPPVDLKRPYDKRGESTEEIPSRNNQRQTNSEGGDTSSSWSNRNTILMSPVSVSQSRFINRHQTSVEDSPSSARSPASMNMGTGQSRHGLVPHQQQVQHLQQRPLETTTQDEEYKNDHGYDGNVGDHGDCVSHQNTTPLGLSFGNGLDKPTPYGTVTGGVPATLTPTSLNAVDCSKSASRDSDKYSEVTAANQEPPLLLDSIAPNSGPGGLGLVLHQGDGGTQNDSTNAYFVLHQESQDISPHDHHSFDPSHPGFDLKGDSQNGFFMPQPDKQIGISGLTDSNSNNNNNKTAPPAGRPLKRFCSDGSWDETASESRSGSELNTSSSGEGNSRNNNMGGNSSGFGM